MPRITFTVASTFVLAFAVACWADRAPESADEATHVVSGTVAKVFHHNGQNNNEYIVQITIEEVERGDNCKAGELFYVYCFQRKASAPRLDAEFGHKAIPKPGDRIRALAIRKNGLMEALYPDWFSLLK